MSSTETCREWFIAERFEVQIAQRRGAFGRGRRGAHRAGWAMAANFWLSSHCNHWIVSSKKEVEKSNPHDRDMLSAEELYQLRLYFVDCTARACPSPAPATVT